MAQSMASAGSHTGCAKPPPPQFDYPQHRPSIGTHARAGVRSAFATEALARRPLSSSAENTLGKLRISYRVPPSKSTSALVRARSSKPAGPLETTSALALRQCCAFLLGSPVKRVLTRTLDKRHSRTCSHVVRAQGEEDRFSFQEYLERQPELPPTVSSSPPQFKPLHEIGDVIVGKYRITGVLGSGGLGTMFEAELLDSNGRADSDSPSGVGRTWEEAVAASKSRGERSTKVALKAMSLRGMKAWKDLELFEREARVLQSLKHPGIAEYIDSFEVDTDADRTFYIAQKVAAGKSIADLVKGGWRVGEEEVKRIALEVLKVLEFLENLRPAVVHRDIKPENIIIDTDGVGGGTGAVKVRELFWLFPGQQGL